MFFILPDFGDNILWISGSANYLMPSVFMLVSIWLIERYFDSPSIKRLIAACVLIFISASTNEMTGGMLVLLVMIKMLNGKKQGVKRRLFQLVMILSAIPTTLMVLLAPGNMVRAHGTVERAFEFADFVEMLVSCGYYFLTILYDYKISCLLSLTLFLTMRLIKKQSFFCILQCLRYVIVGAAGIVVMGFSGLDDTRPTYIAAVVFLIGGIQCALELINLLDLSPYEQKLKPFKSRLKNALNVVVSVCLLAAVSLLAYQTVLYNENMTEYAEFEAKLIEQAKEGSIDEVNDVYPFQSRESCFYAKLTGDMNGFRSQYLNVIYGKCDD